MKILAPQWRSMRPDIEFSESMFSALIGDDILFLKQLLL